MLISNTVNLHFTDTIVGELRILNRIRSLSSVVVVDDISPVVWAGYVDRIRYCGPCVIGVSKTQHSVRFIGCVRYVDGKPKKGWTQGIVLCWKEKKRNVFFNIKFRLCFINLKVTSPYLKKSKNVFRMRSKKSIQTQSFYLMKLWQI